MNSFQKWLIKDFTYHIPEEVKKVLINEKIPDQWLNEAAFIIHRLSETPWTTQEEISKETSLSA